MSERFGGPEKVREGAERGRATNSAVRSRNLQKTIRMRQQGWPAGAIAGHLGLHRTTVEKYLRPPGPPMKRGRRVKYPWHEWADGRVHDAEKGKDFTVSFSVMTGNIHREASRRNRLALTKRLGNGIRFVFVERYWWQQGSVERPARQGEDHDIEGRTRSALPGSDGLQDAHAAPAAPRDTQAQPPATRRPGTAEGSARGRIAAGGP